MTFDSGAPSQSRQTVTAFFESQAEADKARADLLAAGFPEADIHLVQGGEAQEVAEPHQDVGIFRALLNIFVFMPESDRASYEEGLRRGGVALAVHTGQDRYERAIDILDRDGAVDLDERETSWRSDGWSPTGANPTSAGTRPTSADTATFEAAQGHDALVSAGANQDVRERIGTGTADPGAGLDLAPPSAVSPGPERTSIPGEESQSVTSRRDIAHGRSRVRSYVGTVADMPTGVDPSI
jgi:hypothetical protein